MKTIPFDIKLRKLIQSEENHYQGRYKVQTKSGKPARIICWNRNSPTFPIVALVENRSANTVIEFTHWFSENGKYMSDNAEHSFDLCLVDTLEPKFKIGDRVMYKNSNRVYRIADMLESHYHGVLISNQSCRLIPFEDDDLLELVPEKPEFTEFEKELGICLYKSIVASNIETFTKECAPKLLELAKKEVIKKLNEN